MSFSFDGLLPAENVCNLYKNLYLFLLQQDHIVPNLLKRLDYFYKCTTNKPYGKSYPELRKLLIYMGKSYNIIGSMMSDIFEDKEVII